MCSHDVRSWSLLGIPFIFIQDTIEGIHTHTHTHIHCSADRFLYLYCCYITPFEYPMTFDRVWLSQYELGKKRVLNMIFFRFIHSVSFFGLFVCYAGVQSKLKFYCDPGCRQSGTVFINLPFQVYMNISSCSHSFILNIFNLFHFFSQKTGIFNYLERTLHAYPDGYTKYSFIFFPL